MSPEDAPPDVGDAVAMLGWAQLLHDVVERRLRPTGTVDDAMTDLIAPSWDTMFDDALSTVMHQMLQARLERLSVEQFISSYRAVHGDAALLAGLDELLNARTIAARREQTILRLAAQARIAGRLRLYELAPDETVDIGLFDPNQPHLAAWRFRENTAKRPLQRILRARWIEPGLGRVQIISDTWTGAVWDEAHRPERIEPMTSARIGTSLAGTAQLEPELTLHAPITVSPDRGPRTPPTPQIVGYVRTLDGRLLLDASDCGQ